MPPTNPDSEVAIHFIRQTDGRFECADPFATTGHYVEVQTVAKMEAERDEYKQAATAWTALRLNGYIAAWEQQKKRADTLTADLAAKDAEIKILRMQLAGCGAAALANTHESAAHRLTRDNPYWSASYGDVCRAVDREIELREALDRPVIANAVAESQLTALRTACEAVLTWYENDGSIDGAYVVMGNLRTAMARGTE